MKQEIIVEPVELTPEQDRRLVRAIAAHEAGLVELDRGVPLDQVLGATWMVYMSDDDGDEQYLVDPEGNWVLDSEGNRITPVQLG